MLTKRRSLRSTSNVQIKMSTVLASMKLYMSLSLSSSVKCWKDRACSLFRKIVCVRPKKTDPFHWLRIRCLFELNQTSLAGLKPISLLTARQLWERNNVSIECPTHSVTHPQQKPAIKWIYVPPSMIVTSRCPLAADLNRASDRLHRGETRHWPLLKRKHRKKTRHAWTSECQAANTNCDIVVDFCNI